MKRLVIRLNLRPSSSPQQRAKGEWLLEVENRYLEALVISRMGRGGEREVDTEGWAALNNHPPLLLSPGHCVFSPTTEVWVSPSQARGWEWDLQYAFEAIPPPCVYFAGLCDSVKHIGDNSVLPHESSQDIHDYGYTTKR